MQYTNVTALIMFSFLGQKSNSALDDPQENVQTLNQILITCIIACLLNLILFSIKQEFSAQ